MFVCFLFAIATAQASLAAAQSFVQVDKADYYPGETVIVTGSGWMAGELVSLTFDEIPVQHEAIVLFAVANSLGEIRNEEYVLQDHDLGSAFTLSAFGQASGFSAYTYFTDSPKVGSVVVGPASASFCGGVAGSATYLVTVNRGAGSGSSGNFSATLTASSLPPGVTATYSANPITIASQSSSASTTLTLTKTAAAASGAFTFGMEARTSAIDFATTTGSLTVNAPPTITCPANITLDNAPGTCARVVSFTATATGSPTPIITYSVAPGSSFAVGTTSVTATATNSCGSVSCSFNVTIRDIEKPSITAPASLNVTTGPGASTCGKLIPDAALGNALATDNCSAVTVSRSGVPSGNVFPLGSTTITYTATDASGNTATETQVVTVVDDTPPVLVAPAAVSATTGTGDVACGKLIGDAVLGTSTAIDHCSSTTVTRSGVPAGNIFPVGSTTITYTATDASGNTTTATQTVTITDDTPPTIATANRSANTDAGLCSALIAPGTTANDNCGSPTLAGTRSDGLALTDPFPKGATTISWLATDASGNTATATQTILVSDEEDPTIATADIDVSTDPGLCSALVSLGTTVVDNCAPPTLSGTRSDGLLLTDAFPKGTTTVTWLATDASGNTATATQTISVTDRERPTIATAPISASTDPGTCGAILSPGATASDNCGPPTLTGTRSDGLLLTDAFPKGTTAISWIATDASGNMATADQMVTVADRENPTIATAPIAADTDPGSCTARVELGSAAVDNCSAVTLTGTRSDGLPLTEPFPKGTTTVSWLATDASGNTATATQTVSVTDHESPTITAADASAGTDPGLCSATVAHGTTALDNCGTPTLTGTRSDGSPLTDPFPLGTTTISWTATDAAGNTATSTQAITVTDRENPTLTPPAAISITTGPAAAMCGKVIDDATLGSPVASDNCDVRVSRAGVPAGNIFPVGSTTIHYTATDPSGNTATGTQIVTVTDNTPPTITTSNVSVNTDPGLCSATVAHGTVAADLCGTPTLTGTRSDGAPLTAPFPTGTVTISWVATDAAGNTASATQTVSVTDNENPTLTPPAAFNTTTGPGATTCGKLIDDAALGTPVASDNCEVSVSRAGIPAGNIFPVGSTTIHYTATDANGNTATATQIVTVADNTPPVLTAPAAVAATTGPGATICGKVLNDAALGSPLASDNCSVIVERTGVPAGNAFPVGSTTITYKATDPSGNTTIATQVVTVVDNSPPVINVANLTAPTSAGLCTATVSTLGASATDNCSATLVGTRSDGLALTDVYPKGTTTVTWVATDPSGNSTTASQVVTVTNPQPVASITAPASGFIVAVGQPVTFAGTITDNPGDIHTVSWGCDATSFAGRVDQTHSAASGTFTFGTAGVYLVKLTVTDQCNQTSVATTVGGLDAMVVVYDPSAGFVTGGGWIQSPAGAYAADPSLTGKANFGFVSKYKKGQSTPTGETEFQFKTGSLNFRSSSYDWLVISGARAQFKGTGTINNAGTYGFLLTSIDGQVSGGGGKDKFRMKITNSATGQLVYDNQFGATDTTAASMVIDGGSIVIHTSAGFLAASIPASEAAPPATNSLYQNAPNPFNPETTLRFALAEPGRVTLRVYNVRGQLVRTLRNEWLQPGAHQVSWNGRDDGGRAVASGAYFAMISTDRGFRDRIRMVLLK